MLSKSLTHGVIEWAECIDKKDIHPEKMPQYPEVDLRDYLKLDPHGSPRAHSSELMWEAFEQETGISLALNKKDVKFSLSNEEIDYGKTVMDTIRNKYPNHKIVIIAPYSTQNRNIPKETLKKITNTLKKQNILLVMQEPVSPETMIPWMELISHFTDNISKEILPMQNSLRLNTAIWMHADAFVGVDSGPHHLINGGIQWLSESSHRCNMTRGNILTILGSSHHTAVAYPGNHFLQADLSQSCQRKNPCWAHGYEWLISQKITYGSLSPFDKSTCELPEYSFQESSPCMRSISKESIIEAIHSLLFEK